MSGHKESYRELINDEFDSKTANPLELCSRIIALKDLEAMPNTGIGTHMFIDGELSNISTYRLRDIAESYLKLHEETKNAKKDNGDNSDE